MDIFQYFRETSNLFQSPVFLQTDVTALQTQRGLGIFGLKTAPSNSLVQRFLWKNRKNGIFEALSQQDNDVVQTQDMAHSICNDEKKFRLFVSDYLKQSFCEKRAKSLEKFFLQLWKSDFHDFLQITGNKCI